MPFFVLHDNLTSPPVLSYPRCDSPFIGETYVSPTAVVAVLTQKQGYKKIHPMYYATRTMYSAERN